MIGIPYLIFRFVTYETNIIVQERTYKQLAFLHKSYRASNVIDRYWEIVILIRKVCLELILLGFRPFGRLYQASGTIVLITIFLVAEYAYSPYMHLVPTYLERGAMIIQIISYFLLSFPTVLVALEVAESDVYTLSMTITCDDLLARLDALGLVTTTVRHPAVFTVKESKRLRGDIHGAHTKNLFLKDKYRVYLLHLQNDM